MIDLAGDVNTATQRPSDPLTTAERAEFLRLLRRVLPGVDASTYARKGSSPRLRDELSKAPAALRQQVLDDTGEDERVYSVETVSSSPPSALVTTHRIIRGTKLHTVGYIENGASDIDETEL